MAVAALTLGLSLHLLSFPVASYNLFAQPITIVPTIIHRIHQLRLLASSPCILPGLGAVTETAFIELSVYR